MSNEHTPTTEQVRDGFRYDELAEWYDPVTPHHVINGRAFDRWLATVESAAEQRGAEREREDIVGSLIDWDVIYGYEPEDEETRIHHDIASWIHGRAYRLEGDE